MERIAIAIQNGGAGAGARAASQPHFVLAPNLYKNPPVGGTFWFQIFIQAPSPEIWSETISGGEEVLAGKWGGLFLGYLLGKNFQRRDRDPFGREHGRHRAVKRREFIALLGDDACDRFSASGQRC